MMDIGNLGSSGIIFQELSNDIKFDLKSIWDTPCNPNRKPNLTWLILSKKLIFQI